MDKKSKSIPSKTNFHFKEEFFEELLNGIPPEDFEYDDKKNSSVVLSADNKVRFNRVVKEILSSEESKEIFVNLIKNAKKREQVKFLDGLDLFFLKEDEEEEDKDEDDEEIEEIGEKEKKQNVLSKVLSAKKKYDNLKRLSRKKDNFFKIINQVRSTYLALSAMSVAGTLGVRNKTLREMHGYMDPFLNDNFMPFMLNVVYPSVTTSMLNLAMDTTDKLKHLIKSIYDGFRELAGEAIKFGLNFVPMVGPYLSAAAEAADTNAEDISGDAIKIGKKFASKKIKFVIDAVMHGGKAIETIVKNPNMFKDGISAFFILFGSFDENARAKIDLKLQENVKKINAKGEEIIKKIRSPKDTVVNVVDITKEFTGIGIDLYNTGIDYVDNEVDNFESNIQNIIDDKSSLQDKFEFTYRLMANSYFASVDLSPWSRAARLIGGIVKKTSRLFDKLHDRLKESNEVHEGIYYSNGKRANLEDYFDGIKGALRHERWVRENNKKNKKSKSPGNIDILISTRQKIHEKIGENTRFYYTPFVFIQFSKSDKDNKRKFISKFYEKTNEKMIPLGDVNVIKKGTFYSLDDVNKIINFRNTKGELKKVNIIRNEKFEEAINRPRPSASSIIFEYLFAKHFNKDFKNFLKDIKFLNVNDMDFILEENDKYYDFLKLEEKFFKKMSLSTEFDSTNGFYNTILMTETYVHQMKTHIYSKICDMLEVVDNEKDIHKRYRSFTSTFSKNYEIEVLSSSQT